MAVVELEGAPLGDIPRDEIKEEKKAEHLFVCFVEELLFNEDQQGNRSGFESVLTLTGQMEG